LLEDGDEEDEEGDNDYEAEYFDNGEDDDNDDLGGGGGDGGGDGEFPLSPASARFMETDGEIRRDTQTVELWINRRLFLSNGFRLVCVLFYTNMQRLLLPNNILARNAKKVSVVVLMSKFGFVPSPHLACVYLPLPSTLD